MLLRTKALLEADGMVVGWVQCDACADRQIGKGGLISVTCDTDDEGDENVHDESSVMRVRMNGEIEHGESKHAEDFHNGVSMI